PEPLGAGCGWFVGCAWAVDVPPDPSDADADADVDDGAGCEAAAAADFGSRNTSTTHRSGPSATTPTPTSVKSWSRMLSRCDSDAMNAWWMSSTESPTPTFSP